MPSLREILELLSKAKNTRLNLAIFFVSTAILYAATKNIVTLESIPKAALQGLFFITSIRIVYWPITVLCDLLNGKIKRIADARELEKNKGISEKERLDKINEMYSVFESLDIFQLYVIQELRKQNHVSIIKGATLYSLKNLGVIVTPAVGERSESGSLTKLAKEVLDKDIWNKFDELKLSALINFFEGSQAQETQYFREFLSKDSISTSSYNKKSGSTHYYDNEFIFNKYSKTVIFSQPQTAKTYVIDPIAKHALVQIFQAM